MKKILSLAVASGMILIALPAFAAVKAPTTEQVACVGTAVNARETALGAAIGAFTQSLSGAYGARATALQQAYALTPGGGAIKAAVKAAWTAFASSTKSARMTWQGARKDAWTQFRTAVKACKAPAVATDGAMSGNESSGL